jgi:hypothetical protein
MFAVEKELNIPARKGHNGLIEYFREAVRRHRFRSGGK